MTRRSVQITFVNNTVYTLQHYYESICHGDWSNVIGGTPAPNASLPATIEPLSIVQWQTEDSDGSLTGTEGWVKYSAVGTDNTTATSPLGIDPTDTIAELIWIHWNNPMSWDQSTNPLDYQSSLINVNPTCGEDAATAAVWPTLPPEPSGAFNTQYTAGKNLATELFTASPSSSELSPQISWQQYGDGDFYDGLSTAWGVVTGWPILLVDVFKDINLGFVIGLRQKGSVGQSIKNIYPASKGLRVLAVRAKQPSLKKLFAL